MAAALEVFAEQGIDAPLRTVAQRAGVGQGSLYRHFPDRVSLALAAFDDNVTELEAIAADPERTLDGLLAVITTQIIESVAFVDLVTATTDPRLEAVVVRVKATLSGPLSRAQRAGPVRDTVTLDELMLAIGMVAALVAKTPVALRRQTADRAWTLLDRSLRPG